MQTENRSGKREIRSFALDIKASGDDGTVEGYGSVFGVKDSCDDVIDKGAFAKSLAAHKDAGTMPAMLWQHNAAEPIGVWTDMVEDERGLRVVGKLAMDTVRGREAHSLIKMGAINGLSIGFMSKAWGYDRESDIRTLTEVELWELSVVTFPANTAARVTGIKCDAEEISVPKDAEQILRDAGFSKADATAFVSRCMKLGENRRDADNAQQIKTAADRLLSLLQA
jgi:hypothetical protein